MDQLIEKVTHTPGQGRRAFDRYERADYWPQLCAEVGKIEIAPNAGGRVVSLGPRPSTVHGTVARTARDDAGISWRRRESNASIVSTSVLDDSPSRAATVPLANAREPSRPSAVLPHGTSPADALADLVALMVARVIEATAASAPWRDSVTLASGFAEQAARSVVARMTSSPGDGDQDNQAESEEASTFRGRLHRAISV